MRKKNQMQNSCNILEQGYSTNGIHLTFLSAVMHWNWHLPWKTCIWFIVCVFVGGTPDHQTTLYLQAKWIWQLFTIKTYHVEQLLFYHCYSTLCLYNVMEYLNEFLLPLQMQKVVERRACDFQSKVILPRLGGVKHGCSCEHQFHFTVKGLVSQGQWSCDQSVSWYAPTVSVVFTALLGLLDKHIWHPHAIHVAVFIQPIIEVFAKKSLM